MVRTESATLTLVPSPCILCGSILPASIQPAHIHIFDAATGSCATEAAPCLCAHARQRYAKARPPNLADSK